MDDQPVARLPEPEDFYREFAVAVLTWQAVEHSLFRVYWRLANAATIDEAGIAYYERHSFGPKLDLVHAAARTVLRPQELIAWTDLKARLSQASEDRNVLAHFTAVADFHDDGSLELVLAPAIFVPKVLMRNRTKRYDAAECERLSHRFEDLSEELERFANEHPQAS